MARVAVPGIQLIAYIDGFRLHRALDAGITRVVSRQEHLNRINVFPVADGDTGTNLALTLQSVLAGVTNNLDRHAGNLLNAIADAALDGARGNSGAILAQFFQGMSDGATALRLLSVERFARAVRTGAEYAREALSDPREGTIITVLREFAAALDAHVARDDVRDVASLLRAGLAAAERSLAGTTAQLEQLRRAGVVDAGAAGFVELLRGVVEFIDAGSLRTLPGYRPTEALAADAREAASHGDGIDLTHRYCTECVVTGTDIDRRALREQLAEIGSSLVIAGTKQKVKIHVHVDSPGQAFLVAERFGTLSSQKADDMLAQSATAAAHARGVAVITDSGADVPDGEMERLNIHMVPLRLHFGDRGFLDKVSISPREFYDELARNADHPKTSQPAPGDFRRQFQFLATHHDAVLSVNLTSRASGTWQAATSAAARVDGAPRVFDSRTVSAGQALIAMRAAEFAHDGLGIDEIVARLDAVRRDTHVWGAIADLRYAVRGGRVSRSKKLVTDALRLRPVLTARDDGTVGVGGVLFGRRDMVGKFARFVARRLPPARSWRLLVCHGNAPDDAARLRESLVAAVPTVASSWLVELGPALGVHAGPGALVVGAQALD